MPHNDQIWRVATPFVNTSKVAKLPNPHNVSYEELRCESKSPERKSLYEALTSQNGQCSGQVPENFGKEALWRITVSAC
jgi:hypothetical protein